MTADPLVPAPPASPETIPWYQVWLKALTEPRVLTYERLTSHPGVSLARASLWVFLSSMVSAAVAILFVALGGLRMLNPSSQGSGGMGGVLAGSALLVGCLVPLLGVLSVFGLLVSAGISHFLAKALGGVGEYSQLAYGIAAYTAPSTLISAALSFIPCVNWLGIPLSFYLLFLNILTIKAVHRISWGRAVLSSALFVAFALVLVACIMIVILALLGPSIGNVFSGIVSDI